MKHARAAIADLYGMNEREEKGGRKCEVRRSKNWFVVEIFDFDTWNGRAEWRRVVLALCATSTRKLVRSTKTSLAKSVMTSEFLAIVNSCSIQKIE